MVYITYNTPETVRQITFEELMLGVDIPLDSLRSGGHGSTRTVVCSKVPERIMKITYLDAMISQLKMFNTCYKDLIDYPNKWELYDHFEIPKKTGGKMRPIDAPHPELKKALAQLKDMMSGWMFADHHTCAFAYVNGRSTKDAVVKHQRFRSWYFCHFDFHGFFPSTTLRFVLKQMEEIYPFNLILADPIGRRELRRALSLAFLNNGLPQGTPFSPFITNVMMIPFDHKFARLLNEFQSGKCNSDGTPITDRICYTRYADDIHISCRVFFNYRKVERELIAMLHELDAPFTLNTEKTHFGTRAGRNWMLGLMLNKDGDITVGYRNHKILKATIETYFKDRRNGKKWDEEDLQKFRGNISYYLSVEPATIAGVIQKYNAKYGADLLTCISDDLKPKAA